MHREGEAAALTVRVAVETSAVAGSRKGPGPHLEEREGRRPEHDYPVLLTPLFA